MRSFPLWFIFLNCACLFHVCLAGHSLRQASSTRNGTLGRTTLPTSKVFQFLVTKAKQKLRLKTSPICIYSEYGDKFDESTSDDELLAALTTVQQAAGKRPLVLYFSHGEEQVGKVADKGKARCCEYRTIASDSVIDAGATKQLQASAQLVDMLLVCGMPDLHPGNSYPIGATFISKDRIFPPLIGSDIGCGMTLYGLQLPVKHAEDPPKLAARLKNIEGSYPWLNNEQRLSFLTSHGVDSNLLEVTFPEQAFKELGTIGFGNHFAEIMKISEVKDFVLADRLHLDRNNLLLLVHSGSRTLGKQVLETVPKEAQSILGTSLEAEQYMKLHDQALKWARANRSLIAQRVLEAIQEGLSDRSARLLDIWHNFVEHRELPAKAWGGEGQEKVYVHRKGAASTLSGAVVIPGSRGARSYIVMPTGDGTLNAFSLAHGAGRSMTRSSAAAKFSKPFYAKQLHTTAFGSEVVCEDLSLLYEEAPEAYKNIDVVVNDLVKAGACAVIAVMEPVVTYKCRRTDSR